MRLDLMNTIGEINPQLFRELKGRFKTRNIMVAGGMSLFTQILVLFGFLNELPNRYSEYHRYCTGGNAEYYYHQLRCLMDRFGNPEVNWQLWWSDLFVWLTMVGLFALLVGGTYLIISDLDREERKGTLNFIRLSPQSTQQILMGKLLGAPSLLYFGCFLAFPLHLWAAINLDMPLGLLALYYGVLLACSAFFFSGSILFGLVSHWMGGFQAWLGGALVTAFLFFTSLMRVEDAPIDVLKLVSPSSLIPYLIEKKWLDHIQLFNYDLIDLLDHSMDWHWFILPIGQTVVTLSIAMVVTCGVWITWNWLVIDRCFRNPNKTLISKQQSFWLTGCFSVFTLGLAPHGHEFENLYCLLVFNLIFFAGLMAALSPQRQVCVDWARYRHMSETRHQGLFQDLISGDKSPALLAIALNLVEAQLIILPWILMWPGDEGNVIHGIFNLLLSFSVLLVYASVAQLMMMMKSKKSGIWATAAIGGSITLPPLLFLVLSAEPHNIPLVWMFTIFPWEALNHASAVTVMVSVLTQWAVVGLVSTQYSRQLRQAGVSASKALGHA
ncbi:MULTISPECIES: hypothetical protein [unclassified Roseofilum]|uniref:hypothetical protein n=1 Tax=unclassified Roseofilum TaxID=2620099 RepID=UPI000E8B71AC|nr:MULTISPECIES: hypothetical protein [unclassified Roseofilum]MBP0009690.1 ABC transporter permease [Roseofilum sp. Belize Diploria]MBP0034054.1 ABC transporter permease [Roseofilum sp. Belize BBD 4]HBQ97703.1 ABC transporter permease [Cyanobacteria bacterium UBA11691]